MAVTKKHLISFVDASGTFHPDDRFFGVGMLTVENVGQLTNKLHPIFQRVLAISQTYRNQKLDSLIEQNKYDEAIEMLKKTKRFELKFDRLTPVKFDQYKEVIRTFLNDEHNRFAVMVIDRQHKNYDGSIFNTTWDAYTSYLATLVARELTNLPDQEMLLILDEIAKPKKSIKSLEETVIEKTEKQCIRKYNNQKLCCIAGTVRIESHSNLLMQLCDVLLGATMFDVKKNAGILSDKLQKRKDEVVEVLRKGINKQRLDEPFTIHKPVYFHVWNAIWQQK